MPVKKECIAMLLAGGQGSRLGVLTKSMAKPAIPFGGKYRIIDFTLSNCTNSGIDTVGVLTQYQPHELNAYIGSGKPWDLDRMNGGVRILPPYIRGKTGQWYKGTANAVYQNIPFIDQYIPDHVLVLSGDHIYKMDYSRMLEAHKDNDADCTIAVIDVPIKEASRFGIMDIHPDGSICDFEEKPKNPKSTKASMGVYIFKWPVLKTYLELDEQQEHTANDFGKNIIPAMLAGKQRMFAFSFQGYWKDVGTIENIWDASMDLLDPLESLILSDSKWRIYSNHPTDPPHYLGKDARVRDSLLAGGCSIFGRLENSVISHRVLVESGAAVVSSVIMSGARICAKASVSYAIIAEDAVIGEGAVIGGLPLSGCSGHPKISLVGGGIFVRSGSQVSPGSIVEQDI
ncbi:MAG TPA: glucose-1-phosphate adenylyltransferase [Clostridiales bacterium]|nr:glucose-1-phosphate adenylyltransferase [Clostridiales bacterium]